MISKHDEDDLPVKGTLQTICNRCHYPLLLTSIDDEYYTFEEID